MRLFIVADSPVHAADGGDGVFCTPESADWTRRQLVDGDRKSVFETEVVLDPAAMDIFDTTLLD